ncbi:LHFPL tetraspan subfamily member 3 protein-like isoform X2 [Protopterus annectens]|uniref:LHFPL tetraspan subfamily member 3 protein-like isoform X2 n=1 Tax=Protopterus annectens TaxID=7888 RepID=UPI001CFC2C90|nr:LHFPL tetraspan subfamily member 3 protein-like isoform X2 [Protopterus annectens]
MLATQEVAKLYQTEFIRDARAIGVLWAVCTICFSIIEIVVLIQPSWVQTNDVTYQVPLPGAPVPEWLEEKRDSGYFGLYEVCFETDWTPDCHGSLSTLTPIAAFKTAAVFVCMSLILVLTSIGCFGLFWFCNSATVYKICAWLQLTAATCLAIGCLIFPDGWDSPDVRLLCGGKVGRYRLGNCSIHWGYTLAILGIMDSLVLSVLAFVLGNRQDALLPEDFSLDKKDNVI